MLNRLSEYLLVMGIPGLLAISFIDSAAVPLAGGPDAIILLLSWKNPGLSYLVVLAATAGSTLGCLVLYGIGQKGGEKGLSRFNPGTVARIERKMQKNGFWAVMIAVLAPPPFPTKIFVLAAGVLQTGKVRFSAAVSAGRLIRYSLLSYLGARFGDRAAGILKEHYPAIFIILLGCILLILIFRRLLSRKKAARSTDLAD